MRRYTLLVWGSMALSALSLVPVLLGQATAADKPAAARADTPKRNMGPDTVPEDGAGVDDFPASSRLVRDVLKSRPDEDLIICVAGCRPGNDRVVYAQPSDPKALPAVAAPEQAPQPVAERAPENKPSESAASEPAAAGKNAIEAEELASQKAAAEEAARAAGKADAEAETQAKPDGAEEGRMEPTAAEPEAPSEPARDQPVQDESSEGGEPEAMPDGESTSNEDGARGE